MGWWFEIRLSLSSIPNGAVATHHPETAYLFYIFETLSRRFWGRGTVMNGEMVSHDCALLRRKKKKKNTLVE
jgi:hypothetical protein